MSIFMKNFRGQILLVFSIFASVAIGQHHDQAAKTATGTVDLGEISFPTSGPPEAQKHFIDGVLLLHSFEYGRARTAFQEASRIAPNFAMAYWGEAMTHDHRIWGEQNQKAALESLAKLAATPALRRAKAPTEREKLYFDAVEQLYLDGGQAEVAAKYSGSLAELTRRFPDDVEARAFYALSILGLTAEVRNTENYMRGAAIAESIFEKNPRHPGALHYLIHAYDDPTHAQLGIKAARLYGTVAKSASHAQHMPSHIFFALGMWDDSIIANTASMKTARDAGSGGYHPLFWLIHAYLQQGRTDEAMKLVTILEDDIKKSPTVVARVHLAMSRASMLVETRGTGPSSLFEPIDPAGITSLNSLAGHDLASGLEYVRRKDLPAARGLLSSIRSRNEKMKAARSTDATADRYANVTRADLETVAVMEQILDAAIDLASGDREGSLKKATAAGEAEDKLIFEYGPPAIVKPAWEAAGEMFLEVGKKKEAADAFRRALKRYPNRRLSNEGLKAASGN